jgi:hypothetical protein
MQLLYMMKVSAQLQCELEVVNQQHPGTPASQHRRAHVAIPATSRYTWNTLPVACLRFTSAACVSSAAAAAYWRAPVL